MSAATPPGELPKPTSSERERSAALANVIRAELHASGGVLPFARYMELALYAPALGYYTGGLHKFGESGDFVTAPELGHVFARCLARACAPILEATDGEILEAGAGSGALAADLLLELERLGCLPKRYAILELSTELRARQRETLQARAPHLTSRIVWLDSLPSSGFRGVLLANELLDALPVERFRIRNGNVVRLGVGNDDGQFVWCELPASAGLTTRVQALALSEGYESEVGLAAEAWVRSAADALEHGVLLFIDYGFPRGEYYHPDRTTGTLMCHRRHRAHADPLIIPGLQDITAHVDFSAIATAGREAGLEVLGYTSQAMFLLGGGLDEVAAALMTGDDRTRLTVANEIKKLTMPQEMGELFKVMALGRGVTTPLRGFAMQDRRGRL